MSKCTCPMRQGAHEWYCGPLGTFDLVHCKECDKPTWMCEVAEDLCLSCRGLEVPVLLKDRKERVIEKSTQTDTPHIVSSDAPSPLTLLPPGPFEYVSGLHPLVGRGGYVSGLHSPKLPTTSEILEAMKELNDIGDELKRIENAAIDYLNRIAHTPFSELSEETRGMWLKLVALLPAEYLSQVLGKTRRPDDRFWDALKEVVRDARSR